MRDQVVRARDDMPEVAVDGIDAERFAVFVPIVAPRIHGSRRKHLDDLSPGMIPPQAAGQRQPRIGRGVRRTDSSRGGRATSSVQPAVRPPMQAVGEVVIDRKSTRLNSSHSQISYAVFCLKKKTQNTNHPITPRFPISLSRQYNFPSDHLASVLLIRSASADLHLLLAPFLLVADERLSSFP